MQHFFYSILFIFLSLNLLQADLDPSLLDQFHVCTVASYKHKNLDKLIFSCKKHHIDLEVIGLGLPYYGNATRLLRMAEYLNTLDDNDIVMCVDAFDVLIIADKEMILKKFLNMNTPFIMSAEKGCYPFPKYANQYPPTSSPFKFINAGGYIGYVRNLKTWLADLSPIKLRGSDQGQITKHYLYKKPFFLLDYSCDLFLSLCEVKSEEILIDVNDKVVHCLTTGSQPCVIHANGKAFYLWNIIYRTLVVDTN